MSGRGNGDLAMLRRTVRRLLEDHCDRDGLRAWAEADVPTDRGLHQALCRFGVAGLHLPESVGGAGASWKEVGVVLEELGRVLAPVPAIPVLLAATALAAAQPPLREELLPPILAGDRIATVVLTDPDGHPAVSAQGSGSDAGLSGRARWVIDGCAADLLIVVAVDDGGNPAPFVVEADTPTVRRVPMRRLDLTRGLAEVEFRNAPGHRLAMAGLADPVRRLWDLAALSLACELVGTAQAALEMAVEYARTRVQFGRPIGAFQAIKHLCADMLVELEIARATVDAALEATVAEAEDAPVQIAAAKTVAAAAADLCTSANIQIHGGIGFTWDHDAHLYRRRALSSAVLFGDRSTHLEAVAHGLGW